MARPVIGAITRHISDNTATSSASFSHTVTAGKSLLVSVAWRDGATSAGNPTVSTLTFDGANLTFAARRLHNFGGNQQGVVVELWHIEAPTTGTAATVAVTLSEATSAGERILVAAIDVENFGGIAAGVSGQDGNLQSWSGTLDPTTSDGLLLGLLSYNRTGDPRGLDSNIIVPTSPATKIFEHASLTDDAESTTAGVTSDGTGGSVTVACSSLSNVSRSAYLLVEILGAEAPSEPFLPIHGTRLLDFDRNPFIRR